ncbi:MAG: DUF3850 domain-containing protein [Parcubacteria group bacterium]|nr:DUF3850 domain-containing protein [Parcubacteria group bacterium]
MAIIKKKVDTEWFELIMAGKKTYELRLNDFEINEGDTLLLEEVDPVTRLLTGRSIEKKVGFVGKFKTEELIFWSQEEMKEKGFQIISLL